MKKNGIASLLALSFMLAGCGTIEGSGGSSPQGPSSSEGQEDASSSSEEVPETPSLQDVEKIYAGHPGKNNLTLTVGYDLLGGAVTGESGEYITKQTIKVDGDKMEDASTSERLYDGTVTPHESTRYRNYDEGSDTTYTYSQSSDGEWMSSSSEGRTNYHDPLYYSFYLYIMLGEEVLPVFEKRGNVIESTTPYWGMAHFNSGYFEEMEFSLVEDENLAKINKAVFEVDDEGYLLSATLSFDAYGAAYSTYLAFSSFGTTEVVFPEGVLALL